MTKSTEHLDARVLELFEQALEQSSDTRRQWLVSQTPSDPDVQRRVLQLLEADREPSAALRTGGAVHDHIVGSAMPDMPQTMGAYTVKERIGQGGMGAVFRAERHAGDFEHTVAIKIIKQGLLTEKLRPRFHNEQQILASFSHPNIARLYDGGETPDGEPYIVMEYIQGAPITEWATRQSLSLDERLLLFVTVCRAVSYAHQNLIIHRDITPSNVLVTGEGEVKLIDFGIAKPSAEDVEPQSTSDSLASLSFTPGFAAPERQRGAGANTLSDIFSLGKLLELMLPASLRSRELSSIITKATQTDPSLRYSSVEALHEDIDNARSNHVVKAMNGGWSYRFGKFISRNRAATGVSVVALLGLLGALAATTALYNEAEQARRVADERFNDVRTLAKTMMFDIYDDVDAVPGTLVAKQSLALAAQEYLNDLSLDDNAPDALKLEAAQGYVRLADILGSPRMSHTGDYAEAKEYIGKAERIVSELASTAPNSVELLSARRDMALLKAARELYIESRGENTETLLADAIDLGEQALALDPDNLELKTDVLSSRMELAVHLRWDNRRAEAQEVNAEVISEYEALREAHPNDPVVLEELAKAVRSQSEFLSTEDTAQQAIEMAQRGIALEKLRGSADPNASYLNHRAMSMSYRRLGTPAWMANDYALAVDSLLKAIEYTQYIVQRDPGNEDATRALASYQGEVAMSLVELDRFDEAETMMQAAKQYFQTKHDETPDLGSTQRSMMVINAQLTSFYESWGKNDGRCNSLAEVQRWGEVMDANGNLVESDRAGIAAFVESQPPCP